MAKEQVIRLGLPYRPNHAIKNWDSLAALDAVLADTNSAATILDAGAERWSLILPWLSLYGYRRLFGMNLTFEGTPGGGAVDRSSSSKAT